MTRRQAIEVSKRAASGRRGSSIRPLSGIREARTFHPRMAGPFQVHLPSCLIQPQWKKERKRMSAGVPALRNGPGLTSASRGGAGLGGMRSTSSSNTPQREKVRDHVPLPPTPGPVALVANEVGATGDMGRELGMNLCLPPPLFAYPRALCPLISCCIPCHLRKLAGQDGTENQPFCFISFSLLGVNTHPVSHL